MGSITEIKKAFQTSDGTIFATRKEAQKHEALTSKKQLLGDIVKFLASEGKLNTSVLDTSLSKEELEKLLQEKFNEFMAHYKTLEEEFNKVTARHKRAKEIISKYGFNHTNRTGSSPKSKK